MYFDVTDRLPANKRISIELSKPILPIDGETSVIKAGMVTVELLNPDGYLGLVGLDSIFREANWSLTELEIYANVNGNILPKFRGKVFSRPEETVGKIELTARNEMWKIAKTPVTFERFALNQVTYVSGGSLTNIPAVVNGVEYYDGVAVFIQTGDLGTSLKNEDMGDIQINFVGVLNEAKLGRYIIEFNSATDFVVTYPDNTIYPGNISADFVSPKIKIHHLAWVVPTDGDPTGKIIEFFVYKSAFGHPVDIILNELEKAYTGKYGLAPTASVALPIDYGSFARAKSYFPYSEVYVSETNKDNKVWQYNSKYKPLNALQFCQKVADHICSHLRIDDFGVISISTPGDSAKTIFEVNDSECIISHRVLSTQASNYFVFQYGWNDGTESFASNVIEDLRDLPYDDKDSLYFNLPYYKQGVSDYQVDKIAEYIMEKYAKSLTQIEIKLTPNFALPLIAGDKLKLVVNSALRLDCYVEIFDSNVDIGGEGIFKCVRIPEPVKTGITFCEAVWCSSKFCG
jgi:hypothetical protein